MESKTLTILFADVQGYTARTAQQSREDNELFIQEITAFVKKNIEEFSGKFIKSMGDGFMAIFESPTNAVICAKQMQKRISSRNSNMLDEKMFIRLRIGISTGEVSIDESSDVYGDAVNIASRIQNFAQPDEIYIAESTFLAMNRAEVNAKDLGPQKFKNLLREIRVYKIVQANTGASTLLAHEPQFGKKMPMRIAMIIACLGVVIAITAVMLLVSNKSQGSKTGEQHTIMTQPALVPSAASTRDLKSSSRGSLGLESPLDAEINKMRQLALNESDYDKALGWCLEKMKTNPDNCNLLMLTGEVYLRKGLIDDAEGYLQKAYQLEPGKSIVMHRLAQLYEKKGDIRKAIDLYVRCLDLTPGQKRRQLLQEKITQLKSTLSR